MDPKLQESWDELLKAVSIEQNVSALTLAAYLVLGGFLAIYVRYLYRRCGATANDSDSITRIFPLLTLVTIAVISVVKSSMALSLGLVGALSIVRFRSAIKEPEELVYLFLCIGIGLALGANQPLLAIVLVLVASIFVLGMHFFSRRFQSHNLLVTISGDSNIYFSPVDMRAFKAIEASMESYSIQRFDIEDGRGQIRLVLKEKRNGELVSAIARLREQLPDCDLSYVNLKGMV